MQLPDELLKKLRILTDKPISPKVNKQIFSILLHENLNIEKGIGLIIQKYRSDLLIYLMQNGRYPSQKIINSMLANILNKLLQYKTAEVLQLYILILTKMSDQTKILQMAYYNVIKLAIKLPNLQIKQIMFQVLVSNTEYLYKRKCKKVIQSIVSNYIDVFTKFLIYVPSCVSLIELVLDIDKSSKEIINKEHPEKEAILQQIFTDLSSQQLSNLKNQLVGLLQNSKEKTNYYSLHKNCLNALNKIGTILNQFRVKECQLCFTEFQVGQVCRTIQVFLERKGTIDQARFAKNTWMKKLNQLKKIKEMKSEKYINIPSNPSLILDEKFQQKPLFIEQVISLTNNYRLKYQVSPEENEDAKSRIVSVTNNYLKKGIGVGGGRTNLLNKQDKICFQEEKNKNKRLYEGLIDRCFDQSKKEFEYKSFVDKKFIVEEPSSVGISYIDNERMKNDETIKSKRQIDEKVKEVSAFWEKDEGKMQKSIGSSYINEDDEDIQEINNLIQLAYSYKFS